MMNTEQEIKYIEKLLESFFDGVTTFSEEKELYRFFREGKIPAHLERYRTVFDYLETGIAEECRTLPNEKHTLKKLRKRRWVVWSAGIAATLLLFIPVGLSIQAGQQEFNPFEGSYIVRNGVRIDNLGDIMPELELTMRYTDLQCQKVEKIFREISAQEEEAKQIRKSIEAQETELLDQFEDEKVRKMVEKMLD